MERFFLHRLSVSTVKEIRSAIAALSVEERAELVAELCGWTDDEWDRQMRRDSATGKFAEMNREADEANASGKIQPLEQILGDS
jgi:hypothetical protein